MYIATQYIFQEDKYSYLSLQLQFTIVANEEEIGGKLKEICAREQ